MKRGKKLLFICVVLCAVFGMSYSQSDVAGDWISTKTLSSVVKLHSLLGYCVVDNLPDDYSFHLKGAQPDVGNATIIDMKVDTVGVGTGVVITEDGLIMSNAHVTRAYEYPEIGFVPGAGGAPKIGPSGKPLKYIMYNISPTAMFVGLTTKEELESGDDVQKIRYVATVIDDDEDYGRRNRDRALLKIIASVIEISDDNVPSIGAFDAKSVKLSWSDMGNPFKTSLLDKKVRAVGFPGSGDPKRSSRTTGELLGYQSEKYSVLLHTSWISNGNSGGGLFYKDKLIGINTWDNRETTARPVGEAQPITYWADMIVKYNLIWNYNKPSFNYEWIGDDPGADSYKNDAYASFSLVKSSNRKAPVTTGKVYVCRNDVSVRDAQNFITVSKNLDDGYRLFYLLRNYSVQEIYENTVFPMDMIEAFSKLDKLEDIKELLTDEAKPYFDAWLKGEFYSRVASIDEDIGVAVVPVPKNSTVGVYYVDENGTPKAGYNLTVGSGYITNMYTLAID